MSQDRARTKIRLKLSPQSERYARRDAPREARLMAARGALPLPPIDLATVLFALLHDPDAEVKSTARDSLESLPASVIDPVLSGSVHPALLSHFAFVFAEDESKLEKIALNPETDDPTLARLAAAPFKKIVDIISQNQTRILNAPDIVDALGSNPLTGRAVIEKILSFLGVETRGDGELAAPADDAAISDSDAEAALRAILGDEFGGFARALVTEREEADDDISEGSLYALVQKMSVFQKIKLARLGNKEARGLLIRDRNKIVAMSAINSPKISTNEVEAFAKSRNLSDEVLRAIARNRQWTRSYPVKLALAMNPKCPQPVAMKFVSFLHDNDLRSIMKSKDVHGQVSAAARRMLMKKGKI